MELRQLRYFVAVAEDLHFGRAAERLRIVQPTVSQQVARLERELGIELLDRTTRRVSLTAAGTVFLTHARVILDAERDALDAMAALRADTDRTLRIGTNVGLGSRLERVLSGLPADRPVELVSVAASERLAQVRDGRLDAAFIRGVTRSPGLELLHIWDDRLVVALPAAHPLAAQAEIALADLADLPLRIVPRDANTHLFDLVIEACRGAGFEPNLGPPFTTDQDTLAAIGSGRPAWTVYYATQADVMPAMRVAFRPIAEPGLAMPAFLAVRPGRVTSRLADLLAACRAGEWAY